MNTIYGSAAFKAHCLQILDEVAESGQPVVVTKRGRAVATLSAYKVAEPTPLYGALTGTARWTDDLLSADEIWDAEKS